MLAQRFGNYRIEGTLGEGGMGVVYRARDLRLDRPVAIKVLAPAALSDTDQKKRFFSEAKTASALNHPNIITIYEINEIDGIDYIAMECVQGKTVKQLIEARALNVSDALKYALQITDAVAAAHKSGIFHRDIKPANVMVTNEGLVKLLDFGLAKPPKYRYGGSLASTIKVEPFDTSTPGTIVGTVAYMSPEQVQGKNVDARSDIFSFGVLFYEMLTGETAFREKTAIETLSAILHKEPSRISAAEYVSGALMDVALRCLRKDPADRWQSMDEVREALVGSQAFFKSARVRLTTLAQRTARKRLAHAFATVLVVSLAIVGWLWLKPEPAPRSTMVRLTSDSGLTTDPALSLDGKWIAYASDRAGEGNLDIWIRQTSGGEALRVTSDAADDYEPSFSPDGTHVAYRSEHNGGGIYVTTSLGGEARLIAPHGRKPRYSPDGKWIAYWVGERQASASIYVVSSDGGTRRQIIFRPNIDRARYPIWAPDGTHLLFLGQQSGQTNAEWWVASLETGEAVPTGASKILTGARIPFNYALAPADWDRDHILFSAGMNEQASASGVPSYNDATVFYDSANLWRIGINSRTWKVSTALERLTFGTGLETKPITVPNGPLIFASQSESFDIWALPMDTSRVKVEGPLTRLTQEAAPSSHPSISAGGDNVVFRSDRSGNSDIWLKNLETGKETRLGVGTTYKTFPVIARDSSMVAYESFENNKRTIFRHMLRRDGQVQIPEKVCEDCGVLSDISSDGQYLLYYDNPSTGVSAAKIPSGETLRVISSGRFPISDPRFSPDGRWIAFHAITGPVTRQVFVAPFRLQGAGEREWVPITDGNGMDRFPAWSLDGNVLYFVSERDGFRCIYAQRLTPDTKEPMDHPMDVYHFHVARRAMMNFVNAEMARLSVARNRIVFTLGERTGNLWMTELSR